MTEIIVEDVVFCEGFRNEVGGKYTLYGVSAPEINLPQMPAVVVYALWISGRPTSAGPFEIHFRAKNADGQDLFKGKLGGEITMMGPQSIPIGPFGLQVEKEGDYLFEWSFDDTTWKKIASLKINYLPIETTNMNNGSQILFT